MAASVQERCFWSLEAPVARVTGWDTPFPHTTEWGLHAKSAEDRRSHTWNTRGLIMARRAFKLPDIGEGVVEGEIVTWHVEVGSSVSEDDAIVDVMTDKSTVTIPSPYSGTIVS